MRRRDRDAALFFFRCVVDRIEAPEICVLRSFAKTFVMAAVNVVFPWST